MARAVRSARNRPARADTPAAGLRLWAPWRYPYLRTAGTDHPRCIFCIGELSSSTRRRRLVLHVGAHAMVMLNAYPYNNGHVMVAPRRHLASPELLAHSERNELNELVTRSVELLRKALNPEGFNIGANLGPIAGAGFADHLHWHVVPRWAGDNNFMPVLASTRVLSQHLLDSYRRLHPLFKAIKAGLS
jgi:ATP adenylyltransferase